MTKLPTMNPTISLAPDGRLHVQFDGFSINLPLTEAGIRTLANMLAARDSETTIAMPGELTQWQLDQMVKDWAAKQPEPDVDIDLAILKGLGL